MMHGWALGIAIRVITYEINTAFRYLYAPQKKCREYSFLHWRNIFHYFTRIIIRIAGLLHGARLALTKEVHKLCYREVGPRLQTSNIQHSLALRFHIRSHQRQCLWRTLMSLFLIYFLCSMQSVTPLRDLIFYCKSCMTADLMKSWSSAFYIRSERNALPLTFVCVWYTIIKTLYPNLFHVLNCTAECDILYLSSGKMQTLEQHVTSPKRF